MNDDTKIMGMNSQQLEMIVRWVLGPLGAAIGGWLISKGASESQVQQLGGYAFAAILFLVQFGWSLWRKTDKQQLAQASTIKGAEVKVDTSVDPVTLQPVATPGALAAAVDERIPNVVAKVLP